MASVRKISSKVKDSSGKVVEKTRYRCEVRKSREAPISKNFDRKKDAVEWGVQMDADKRKRQGHTLGQATVKEMFEKYFTKYPVNVGKNGKAKNSSGGTNALWWVQQIGHMKVAEVDVLLVDTYIEALKDGAARPFINPETGKPSRQWKKDKSGATVNRYRSAISTVYKKVGKLYGARPDMIDAADRFKETTGRENYLPKHKIKAMFEEAQNLEPELLEDGRKRKAAKYDRMYLLLLMAVVTGLRRSNIEDIRWSDIDMENRRVLIGETKNGDPNNCSFSEAVKIELKKFFEIGNGYVFRVSDTDATKKSTTFVWENLQRKLIAQGVFPNDFIFHDLRHTCASLLADNGATLLEIMAQLGHKTTASALRYTHLTDDKKQEVIDGAMGDIC